MKANEAPEKIYLLKIPISGEIDEKWLSDKSCSDDIEYIRTDAFIEKACDWLESVNLDFYQIREGVFSRELTEDFRKAMKGK